jgi:hypothetical protein
MNHKHDSKKRSASFDGDWNEDKQSMLNTVNLKLREWEKEMIDKPELFSPETWKLIAQVVAVSAQMDNERRYAELVGILMWLEPLIVTFVNAELLDGRLTKREFARYSKVLRDIEIQSLRRFQNLCDAG